MTSTRPPKGHKLGKNDIKITPQTPDYHRQQQNKNAEYIYQAKTIDKTVKINFNNNQLEIDNKVKIDEVMPPTAENILMRSQDDELDIQKIFFYSTNIVTESRSRFQMFCTEIKDTAKAKKAYIAIQKFRIASSSSHLISAYRLADGTCGWRDDGDFGMGKFLFNQMKNKAITNTIIFVARNFGGVHLGLRRFHLLTELLGSLRNVIRQEMCLPNVNTGLYSPQSQNGTPPQDKEMEGFVQIGPQRKDTLLSKDGSDFDKLAWDGNNAISKPRQVQNSIHFQEDYFDCNQNISVSARDSYQSADSDDNLDLPHPLHNQYNRGRGSWRNRRARG